MRIVFLGPPGAGKGTQAVRVAQRLEVPHLSTGEMLRKAQQDGTDMGRQAAAHMAAGRLVPSELVQQLVADRIAEKDCRGGYLLDGFPRTVDQAEHLDAVLAGRGAALDQVVNIDVDEGALLNRLANRGRQDDADDVVRERLRTYHELTEPLADYYRRRGVLVNVDGNATPDEVFDRIMAIVAK